MSGLNRMHKYKLYDVAPDGKKTYTDKVISANIEYGNNLEVRSGREEVVLAIFKEYGFTQYVNYMICINEDSKNPNSKKAYTGNFYIKYTGGSGELFWFLEKGL